jgi:UDP-N-acetylmuramate: L-alanyl-gamma-D-glutamyl-meso-diaminopimelate ligase
MGEPLVVLFEPRSATSRRKIFQKAFSEALQEADFIWVAPPFDQSRIEKEDQLSADTLVEDLGSKGRLLTGLEPSNARVWAGEILNLTPRPSTLVFLSNGSFSGLLEAICEQVR